MRTKKSKRVDDEEEEDLIDDATETKRLRGEESIDAEAPKVGEDPPPTPPTPHQDEGQENPEDNMSSPESASCSATPHHSGPDLQTLDLDNLDPAILRVMLEGAVSAFRELNSFERVSYPAHQGTAIEGEEAIVAYKASANMTMWPTFITTKQKDAIGRDVLCLPMDNISRTRRQEVLDALRGRKSTAGSGVGRGKDVMLVGGSGIGKSSEMNFYLHECVRHMGEEGWFSTVLFRCPERLVVIRLEDHDQPPRVVLTIDSEKMNLKDLSHKIGSQNFKNAIILLELDEEEINPAFSCRVLVSLSSRSVTDVTKTMSKSGVKIFIVSPPSPLQMELMAKALWELSSEKEALCENLNVATEAIDDVLAEVRRRLELVGPLPRFVFGESDYLNSRVSFMAISCRQFFEEVARTNIFNIPSGAKYYVAPFVQADAPSSLFGRTTPDGRQIAQLGFLCDRAATLIANAVNKDSDRNLLTDALLD